MSTTTRPIASLRRVPSLRRILRANGVFCTVAGAIAVGGAGGLGAVAGLPPLAVTIIGATTVAYGLFLLAATARLSSPFLLEWTGWTTFFTGAIWVVASPAILLTGQLPLTPAGRGLVFAVGEIVALFAFLELRALRRRR